MRIMVLTDGETFSGLDGCAIFEIEDGLEIEEIEEMLAGEDDAGMTLVKRFGPPLPCDENQPRFIDLELHPFRKDPDDNWPDDTLYLYEVEHGALFEDAQGNLFNVVGYGPVQGSIEIVDDDEAHGYWDVTTRVRLHGVQS